MSRLLRKTQQAIVPTNQHSAEILQIYSQIFQSLETRVLSHLSKGEMSPKEALDALISFSIAEEGTKTLFL
jgi:hypothetical protein